MKVVFDKDKFLEILEDSLGIISDACKQCNISRQTYYNYYKKDNDFKDKVDEINESALDFVESRLFKRIAEGSDSAIFYYLNNKGKSRGYNNTDVKVENVPKLEIKLNGINEKAK